VSLVWLACLFLFAFTIQNALGFGSTIVVVAIGAQLLPIDALLPLVVPISCVATSAIVWRDREHLAWSFLLRRVLPCMGPGVVVGLFLLQAVEVALLKRVYGVMVVALAAVSLWSLLREQDPGEEVAAAPEEPVAKEPARGTALWVASAGIVHGLFASGGPLLVYAAQRLGLSKGAFRGTLSLVWLVLNAFLSVAYALSGRLGQEELTTVALLLPALAVSLVLGDWIHRRLDLRRLRLGVLSLLLVAGGMLML
jgi:uncharacterized membrane protein YfcA